MNRDSSKTSGGTLADFRRKDSGKARILSILAGITLLTAQAVAPVVALAQEAPATPQYQIIDASNYLPTGDVTFDQGQHVVIDFSSASSLLFPGSLTNSGVLYAVSTNPAFDTAAINAANINNQEGAVISTVLPAGGIPGFTNALASLNLTLNAVQNIVNQGTIASSGDLTATAGSSIINSLLTAGAQAPIMQALQDLNLSASSIVNQGLLASQAANLNAVTAQLTNTAVMNASAGSVNIENLLGSTLNIQNTLGTILALEQVKFSTLAPAITSGSASFTKGLLLIEGGSVDAKIVQFDSPAGAIDSQVERIAGSVNISGGSARLAVKAGDLHIGSMNLTGDPVIANSGGDVTLPSSLVFHGQDLAVLASGNVLGNPLNIDLSALDSGANGGDLTIVAGYNFDVDTASTQIQFDEPTPRFTITGPSDTGGSIVLRGLLVNTSAIDGDAGDVTIVAHSGTNPSVYRNGGVLYLNGPSGSTATNIDARSDNGSGGDVLIIAHNDNIEQVGPFGGLVGGTSDSIILPDGFHHTSGKSELELSINTSSNSSLAGSVQIYASEPQIVGGSVEFIDGRKDGSGSFAPSRTAGGALIVPATTFQNSDSQQFLSGNLRFRGEIISQGPGGGQLVAIGGRNVSVSPNMLVDFHPEARSLTSSGDLQLFGQDSLTLESGLYQAGQTTLSEDAFDESTFWTLVDLTSLLSAGSVSIVTSQLEIAPDTGYLSNFGDINFKFDRLHQPNSDPVFDPTTLQLGTVIARGGNVNVLASTSPLKFFGTIVARAVDEPLPYRGGGIGVEIGVSPTIDLAGLLATQPLLLPPLAEHIVREDRSERTTGQLVEESHGLGEIVQVYRDPASNWAALQTSGLVDASTAEFAFKNGAIILNAGSGVLTVVGSQLIVAAPDSDSAPPPPPPPPLPTLTDRPDLPPAPAEQLTFTANFNLLSTASEMPAATLLAPGSTIEILQGTDLVPIAHLDSVTAGQYIAVLQVRDTGAQPLVLSSDLDKLGVAIGGSFSITAELATKMAGLVIPADVTALHNASDVDSLDFHGDLVNFGSYLLFSSNATISSVQLLAENVVNHPEALITTVLPGVLPPGVVSASASLTLNIEAVGDVFNSGLLSSSGHLSITAGGAIVNALPTGAIALPPAILAAEDLSLSAPVVLNLGHMQSILGNVDLSVNELANLSILESLLGNVSIQNSTGRLLNINNLLGTIAASNLLTFTMTPVIDAFSADQQSPAIALFGGALVGQSVQFVNPSGAVSVNTSLIEGEVSTISDHLNLIVGTGTLKLASTAVDGDQFIANYGGDVELTGLFSPVATHSTDGGELFVLAFGSIFTPETLVGQLDSIGSNVAGNITVGAGVQFTLNGDLPQTFMQDLASTCLQCLPAFSVTTIGSASGTISLPSLTVASGGAELNLFAAKDIVVAQVTSAGGTAFDSGPIQVIAGLAGLGSLLIDTVNASATAAGKAGGSVELAAAEAILVSGIIDTSSAGSSGGDVRLEANAGSVAVNFLGPSAATAVSTGSLAGAGNKAGNVSITSRLAVVTVNGGISASAGGQAGAGDINIEGDNVAALGALTTTALNGDGGAIVIASQNSVAVADLIASGGLGSSGGSGGLIVITAGISGSGDANTGNLVTTGSGSGNSGGLLITQAPGAVTIASINTSGSTGASGGAVLLSSGVLPTDEPDLLTGTINTTGTPAGPIKIIPIDLRGETTVQGLLDKLDFVGNRIKALTSRPFLEIPFVTVRSLTSSQFNLLDKFYTQQIVEIAAIPDGAEDFAAQLVELNTELISLPSKRNNSLSDLNLLQDIQTLGKKQLSLQEKIDRDSLKLEALQIRLGSESDKPFLDQNLPATQGLLMLRSRSLTDLSDKQITLLELQTQQLQIQLLRTPDDSESINLSLNDLDTSRNQIVAQEALNQNDLLQQLTQLSVFAIPLQSNLKLQQKVAEKVQQVQNSIDLQSTFEPTLWSDWNGTQKLHLLISRIGEQINLTDLQIQQVELELLNAPLVGANTGTLQQTRTDLLTQRTNLSDTLTALTSELSDATYGQKPLPPPPVRNEERQQENRFVKLLSELRDQMLPELTQRLDNNAEQLNFISNLPQVEHEFEVQLANALDGSVPFIPAAKGYQTIELPSGDESTDIGRVVNQARFMLDIGSASISFADKTAANGAAFNLQKTMLETEIGGLQFQEALFEGKMLQIQNQQENLGQQFDTLIADLGQQRTTVKSQITALEGQLQALDSGSANQSTALQEISSLREQLDIKERVLSSLNQKESIAKVQQQSKLTELTKESTRLSGQLQEVRAKLTGTESQLNTLTQDSNTVDRPFLEQGFNYLKTLFENTETFYQVKRTDINSKLVGLIEIGAPPLQASPSIVASSVESSTTEEFTISSPSYHYEFYTVFGEVIFEGPIPNNAVQGPAYEIQIPGGSSHVFDDLVLLLRTVSISSTGGSSSSTENDYLDQQYSYFNFFDKLEASLPRDLGTLPEDLASKLAELPGLAQTPKLLVPFVQEVNSNQLGQYQQSATRLGQSNLIGQLKDGTPVEQALAIRTVDRLEQAKALADAKIQQNALALANGAANFAQGIKDALAALQGTVSGASSGQDLQNQLLATQAELLNLREGDISDEQLSILNAQLSVVNNLLNASAGLSTLQNAGFESLRKSLSQFLASEVEMASDVVRKLNGATTLDEAQSAMNFSDSAFVNYGNKISNHTELSINGGIDIDRRANTAQQFQQTQIVFDTIQWNSSLELMAARDGIKGPLVSGWSEIFNLNDFEAGIGLPPSLEGRLEAGFADRYRSNSLTESDKEVMNEALPFLLEKAKPLMLQEVAITAQNQNALVAANQQLNASKQSGLRTGLGQTLDNVFEFAQSVADWGFTNMSPLSAALQHAPDGFSPTGTLLQQVGFYGDSVGERREKAIDFRKEFLGDVHTEIQAIGDRLAKASSNSEFTKIYFSQFLYQQNLGDRTVSSINNVDLKAYQTWQDGSDAFVNTTVSIASVGYGSATFNAVRGMGLGLLPAASMSLAATATLQGSATGLYVGIDSLGRNDFDTAVKEMSTAYLTGYKQGFLNQAGNLLAMPLTGPLTAGISKYTGQLPGQYLGGFLDAGLSNAISEGISVTSNYAQGKIAPGVSFGEVLFNTATQAFTDGMKTHALFGAVNIAGSGLIKGLNGAENWSFTKPGETAILPFLTNTEQRLDRFVGADQANVNPSQTELRLERIVSQDKLALQKSGLDKVVADASRAELNSGESIRELHTNIGPDVVSEAADVGSFTNRVQQTFTSLIERLAGAGTGEFTIPPGTYAYGGEGLTTTSLRGVQLEIHDGTSSKVVDAVLAEFETLGIRPERVVFDPQLSGKAGSFSSSQMTISVKASGEANSRVLTFDHETGHLVDSRLLDPEIRQQLQSAYHSMIDQNRTFISDQLRGELGRQATPAEVDALVTRLKTVEYIPNIGQDPQNGSDVGYLLSFKEMQAEMFKLSLKAQDGSLSFGELLRTYTPNSDRVALMQPFGGLFDVYQKTAFEPIMASQRAVTTFADIMKGADQSQVRQVLSSGDNAQLTSYLDGRTQNISEFAIAFMLTDRFGAAAAVDPALLSPEIRAAQSKLQYLASQGDGYKASADPLISPQDALSTQAAYNTLTGINQSINKFLNTRLTVVSAEINGPASSVEQLSNLPLSSNSRLSGITEENFSNFAKSYSEAVKQGASPEVLRDLAIDFRNSMVGSPPLNAGDHEAPTVFEAPGLNANTSDLSTKPPSLSQRQQGLLSGAVEAKELIGGNTSGFQTFFAVHQSPENGPKVVIARVTNEGAAVPGGENFAERVTFEQAAHQLNQMLGFDSPYPATAVREVTLPDGSSAPAMVQELAGSKSLSQYLGRPPASKVEAKAFDAVFEQALVERLIYGDSDMHGANFMVSGRGESVKVSNIDLGRGFSQETEPKWFLPEGAVSPDSAEGQIMMFSGKSISPATQLKINTFAQLLKDPSGTEALKGLGLSDAQIKGVAGRAQFFAETGRFPEMESMPAPSEANALPTGSAPQAVPFKSETDRGSSYQPVAFSQPVASGVPASGHKLTLPRATVLRGPDARVSLAHGGIIRLKSGESCINSNKDSAAIVGDATVTIAAGAIVLLTKEKSGATISVLHDRGAGDVRVSYGNMQTSLSTGQALSIHRKTDDLGLWEGHRRIVNHSLDGGIVATSSEVSLPHLLLHHPVLKLMAQSNDRFEQSLVSKITKTAACLHVATGAHGPYAVGPTGK